MSGTIIVEIGLRLTGLWLYARRNRGVRHGVFVAFLLAVYAANLIGLPPRARAVAIVGLASLQKSGFSPCRCGADGAFPSAPFLP